MTTQVDKKVLSAKIAKVRELVHNATNNDIIMVLHSFELDVDKTVQAFCEDGAASILGDWVQPAGASKNKKKRNNNNKSKKTSENVVNETVAASSAAPVAVSQPSTVQPKQPSPAPKVQKTQAAVPVSNGVSSVPTNVVSKAFKDLYSALQHRESELQELLKSNPKASLSLNTSALIQEISSFGTQASVAQKVEPVQKKTAQAPIGTPAAQIKHATSQSSITSSGNDSGVNLSPLHKEEPKPASKQTVTNGGIQMSSDGLSAEQLAALQQTLQLQLAAKGLDASILTSGENLARRPPRKPDAKKNGAQKNNTNNTNSKPKLSIL